MSGQPRLEASPAIAGLYDGTGGLNFGHQDLFRIDLPHQFVMPAGATLKL